MQKPLDIFGGLGALGMAQTATGSSVQAGVPHLASAPRYVEVYAHRGARSFSPENTLPAYITGLRLGADWVDLDIGISRDGVMVVTHDLWLNPDILRHKGKFWARSNHEFLQQLASRRGGLEYNLQPYLVKNLSWAELQQYDAGSLNPASPYAKYFPQQYSVKGATIPSVQQVVDTIEQLAPGQLFYQIEIKNDPLHPSWTVSPLHFAAELNQFLIANQLEDRAEIQAFDWQTLYTLHQLNPRLKLAFLLGSDDIARMRSEDPKLAGQWSGGKLLKDYNNSLPHMVKALGGCCYEPEDVALTKADLEQAHQLGLKVVVWSWPEHSGSTFDSHLIAKLIEWGVDGIITDDPARLNSMLAARGMRLPQPIVINR